MEFIMIKCLNSSCKINSTIGKILLGITEIVLFKKDLETM